MLEGAGFEVFDLGINTDADKFLAALELHKPDILGMSALLTTTMPYMKVVIDTLKEKGIRDDYIVSSAARRSTRNSARPWAPTRTAATPPSPKRRARSSRSDEARGVARTAPARPDAPARPRHRLRRAGPVRWCDRHRAAPAERVTVACLPPALHMRPERIAGAVATRIARARRDYGPDTGSSWPTPTAGPGALDGPDADEEAASNASWARIATSSTPAAPVQPPQGEGSRHVFT